MGIWYCTREDVASAADIKASANQDAAIDSAIESASRAVEGKLHRRFYPELTTRYFDWPNMASGYNGSFRLWLDENEVISVSSMTSGGVAVSPSNFFLEPANDGPPFDRIELNRSIASWRSGYTNQRSIAVTGLFGFDDVNKTAGTCTEALDASETQVDYSGSPLIGVGSVIRIDAERMVVVAKDWASTGQTVSTLQEESDDATFTVSSGAAFFTGETILIDGERMLITDIAGNSLTVQRAVDGSGLVSHTAGTIYARRSLTVERGALGTTPATHVTSAPITVLSFPGLVRELCIAYALNNLSQRSSSYARVVGSGDNQRESAGRGVRSIEQDAYQAYGRKARMRSV